MALISEARFGVGDIQVQSPDNRLVPRGDTTTAQAIQAFGDVGGDIRKGILKGQLKNEIEESANIISSINAGYPQLQKDIQSGQINDQSEKFYRLSLAAEQGKISEQRATLEAEVLLRSSIAKAPGFADEFRRTAREALGFDPTGAALGSLFLSGPDVDSDRLTQEQKDIEQAQAMVSGGAVASVQDGVKLINSARVSELRQKTTAAAIKNGTISSGKVAIEGAQRVADATSGILLTAFTQIRNTGGIQDVEALKASVMATAQLEVRKLEKEMAESTEFVYDPQAYEVARTRMLEVAEAQLTLLDNQDVAKILARKQDQLQSIADIGLFQVAPDLAVLAPLGEAAITSYLDLMVLSGGDPRKRQELINRDPRYAWIADVDMDSSNIAGSLKAIADGTLAGRIATGEIDETTGIATLRAKATQAASGETSPEEFDQIVSEIFRAERPREAVSVIAANPASYANMSAASRTVAAENLNVQTQQQASNIAGGLRSKGYELRFEGGRFSVVDPQGRNLTDLDPLSNLQNTFSTLPGLPGRSKFESSRLANQAGVGEAVSYLNDQLLPIMRNVQWSNQAGFGNVDQWARQVTGTTNASPFIGEQAQDDLRATAESEGFVATPTRGPDGFTNIGHGHNLDANPLTTEDYEALGIDPSTPQEDVVLNEEQAKILLRRDVEKILPGLQEIVPEFNGLARPQKKALIDMAINMGVAGVRGFEKMRKAIAEGDFEKAAEELLDSKYGRGETTTKDGKTVILQGLVKRAQENAALLRGQ